MKNFYVTLGIGPHATPAEVKAAFQEKMKALEGPTAGLTELERAAREKILRQAFITLFDPAARARYDGELGPSKHHSFVSETVAPHEVVRKNPFVMLGVVLLLVAVIAWGWYVTHPAVVQKMEKEYKEAHKHPGPPAGTSDAKKR